MALGISQPKIRDQSMVPRGREKEHRRSHDIKNNNDNNNNNRITTLEQNSSQCYREWDLGINNDRVVKA